MLSTSASTHQYICYILRNNDRSKTYVGITNNMPRRLRQHNGGLRGGARYTRGGRPWKLVAFVRGFVNKSQALSFEWYMHHRRGRVRASAMHMSRVEKRIESAHQLMMHHKFARWPLTLLQSTRP
jgi:structure-specific endonuclease subunit SLX1